MCGIFGRYSRSESLGDLSALRSATNYLSHRGPDGGAWWADDWVFLGHRRLSIIDIEGGTQPMTSGDRRYAITFNGEIYNYIELRNELLALGHTLQSSSDTEIIIEGYRRWGEDVCSRLMGMFAFAIVDRNDRSIFIARDRFGEKPLFVMDTGDGVTFSSEFGAFCALPEFKGVVNTDALGGYLCLNYVPGAQTLATGVERLTPGTWRRYSLNGVNEQRFWSPPEQCATFSSIDDAVESVGNTLDEGVKIALRSDVPVTAFLSGGIDSSLIVESAVRQGNIKHAYCLDFADSGHSEFPAAKQVGGSLGIDVRGVPLSSHAMGDFLSIVDRLDDPLADSSAIAVWALARETSEDYKVALSGDGGDELFGGYMTYQATAMHNFLHQFLPGSLSSRLARLASTIPVSAQKVSTSYKLWRFLRAIDLEPSEAHFTWNGTWLPDDAANFVSDADAQKAARNSLHEIVSRYTLRKRPTTRDLQSVDVQEYLPNDILTKMDRTSMAFGLESRAPFLFGPLADLGLSLPDSYKITPFNKPKRILRLLAERRLGPKVSRAKKQGFSIPVHNWLRGPARHIMEDLLSTDSLKCLPFLNGAQVQRVKDAHVTGAAQYGFELWGLMVLVAWHRARIMKESFVMPSSRLQRLEF